MNLFAQIDPNLLSFTGVIATILAVIFGIGAFYNSRTRKKHLMDLERAQKEQPMHFRPAKSSHPAARSALPARSTKPHHTSGPHRSSSPRASTPKAAPLAKSSSLPDSSPKQSDKKDSPAPAALDAPALFRKVRPSGVADMDLPSDNEENVEYHWE